MSSSRRHIPGPGLGWAGVDFAGVAELGELRGGTRCMGFPLRFLVKEAKPVPTKDLVIIYAPPYFQIFRHPCRLLWAWCTLSKNLNFTITLPTTMASLLETCLDLYNCRNLDKVRILIFFHYYGSLLIFLGFKNKRNILPDSAFGA